ncbi:hypothetical protein [Altibacter sp.]|uniref:hypothetical protein n=1 Tax=Altibacter sp. TaxID=2024823 RepID=UPI000C92D4D6|nr:hypothetical protein [Altibacter sp.]MAP53326.1 hypothetical protein [Altibacter sp.]|tara:strand:- start:489 stop:746 length:258 start_codon:yes stop_codon:yes gene_type:complete
MKKVAIIAVTLLFMGTSFTSCRETKEEEMTESEALIQEMEEEGAEIKVKEDDGDTKIKMETEDKSVKIKEDDGDTKIKVKTDNDN